MTNPTRDRDRLLALAAEGSDIPYTELFDAAAVITGLPRDSTVLTEAMCALCDAVVAGNRLAEDPSFAAAVLDDGVRRPDPVAAAVAKLDREAADALSRLGVAP